MKKLKESTILKITCYVLGPAFAIIALLCIYSITYVSNNPDTIQVPDFYQTKIFSNIYEGQISNKINNYGTTEEEQRFHIKAIPNTYEAEETEEMELDVNTEKYLASINENNIIYEISPHYTGGITSYKYIVIKEEGIVYTNIDDLNIYNIEQYKNQILEKQIHWVKPEKNVIITNVNNLNKDSLYSSGNMQRIANSESQIYTYIDTEYVEKDYIYTQYKAYEIAVQWHDDAYGVLASCIVSIIIMIGYLFISTGHKKGEEKIVLNRFDKLSIEIASLVILTLGAIAVLIIEATTMLVQDEINTIIFAGFGLIPFYLVAILTFITGVRRVKSNTVFKNSVCYKLYKTVVEYISNIKVTFKAGAIYSAFAILTVFLVMTKEFLFIFIMLIMWFAVGIYILNKAVEYNKIKEFINKLYEGNNKERLNENEFRGEYKKIVPKLNDIASGFSNAIEKEIQSERLKTELITNVSHDIKTPLTSIINYVDLIKKEDIKNEKVKEYLEVLDKKSQRLKKLTEDLVEASKVSSGNIKLEKTDLDIKELLSQGIGEFDEKFSEKKLQIITSYPKEKITINADGKYMSRILENIYSNIYKYSLLNSRVYIDVKIEQGKNQISFKNISNDKLNITTEELMQRFVRGDKTRTTEGSGLGLSIAQSLTELQGGKFEIYLDGDLFKVVLEF